MSTETSTGTLPKGWVTQSLVLAADVVMGQSPPGASYNADGIGSPFFQGKTEFGQMHPTVKKWTTAGTKRAIAGDILLSVRAPVGPTNVADIDCVIGRGLAAIRAKKHMNQVFLLWFLRSFENEIAAKGTGTTFDSISGDALRNQLINVPPSAEQEKIVEILEEQLSRLDAALTSVQAVQKKATRFRRSLLNSIFENQFQKHGGMSIEEMLELLPSGRKLDQGWSPQCLRQPVENAEDWGVLITTAVQHGRFDWNENKLLPKTMAPRHAIEVKDGDFLMTRLGPRPRCGVACMVRETRSQLMVPDKMYRFRPNQNVLDAKFLNIYITSPRFLDAIELLKTGTSESGMNITQSRFLAVEVPRTPVKEQIEIALSIDLQLSRLDASLAVADAIEKKASALRRSLLHAAFTGDLTKEWREGVHV